MRSPSSAVSRALQSKLGPVMLATLSSQLLAALGLAATPLLGFKVSDTYALGVQIGNASLAGIVVGVVYLLAIGRPWFADWKRWTIISAAFSLALPVAVSIVSIATRDLPRSERELSLVVTGLFGVGGAALAAAGVVAVRAACLGRPLMLAALTVVPNLVLLVSVGIARLISSHSNVVAGMPAGAWALACGGVAVAAHRSSRSWLVETAHDAGAGETRRLHTVALASGVVTSSVFPPLYITAVSDLRSGTATILFLITKAGSSLVGLAVNSALLVRYNWTSTAKVTGRASTALNTCAAVLAGIAFVVHGYGGDVASYILVVIAWALTLVSSPLVMREINARRLGGLVLTKTVLDILASSTVIIILFASPSFTGYLAAFVMSQAITTAVGGVGLRNKLLTVSSIALIACAAGLLLGGW